MEKRNTRGGNFQTMIKQTQKHKGCTCKREKNKLQVVLHQDKRNTRRGQTKRKKTKEKTWTIKKTKTQGLHLQEKKHKRFIKERRNTQGHYLSIHPLLTITKRH
jgi:hypothetical protein